MPSADPDVTVPAPQFEWAAEEIRRVGYRIVDLIADHLATLPDRPVFQPVPRALAERLLSAELPQRGESVDRILDQLAADVAAYPFGNGHPRFYGWVNSPPAVLGVLVDAVGAAMNPSVAGGNHAAVWVERQVLEWFKGLVALPKDSMGLLVSGASSAALTALAVARHTVCSKQGLDVRSEGLRPRASSEAPRLLIYKGGEGHGCHQKAVEMLGLGSSSIRVVPHDAALRMIPDALDAMIREDSAQGHFPMAVIASAGTVNTGAVDPLDALADVCQEHRVWFHVDAAYGGPALLTEAHRPFLSPMSRADSIAIDPHKWFYVPVDAGVVLIRDASAMRSAFSLVPPYLRTDGNIEGVQGPPWFSEFGLEQTRPFRALKVWATLKYFGMEGYRALIEHDIAMARHLAERIRNDDLFELWEPQGLSIVCFRVVPKSLLADTTALDALNQRVLTSVQLGGQGFLSSTILEGRLYLRACIVNPRATEADVDSVLEIVRSTARGCLGA
jgi:aromatic-L-amino-acid/L-tryptophan decarboxylase